MRFRARVRAQGRTWRPRTSGTMFLEVFAGKGELTQAFKDKGITTFARIDIEAPDGGLLRQYNKKRDRFCASRVAYEANGQKPAVVLPARNAQFQKSRMTPATKNPAQTRQEFFWDFF